MRPWQYLKTIFYTYTIIMSAVLEVTNLTKQFNDLVAVNDLTFTVPTNSIYGFLGQNGAGKSTTIRMLLTLIKPTNGSIKIFGESLTKNPNDILQNIGAVIERPDLYKYLTAYENVALFAKLSRVKATNKSIMDVLDKVGLADRATSKMKTFSQGMKQRLGIATALIHNPQLIILDEPVNGLDPQGIADIRNLILHLKNELNKTILLSSHLLSEMEMIATDLLIISKGKKVVEGKIESLLNPAQLQIELITSNNNEAITLLNTTAWKQHYVTQDTHTLLYQMPKATIPAFNQSLTQLGIQVYSLRAKHSLEDYFLTLTNTAA